MPKLFRDKIDDLLAHINEENGYGFFTEFDDLTRRTLLAAVARGLARSNLKEAVSALSAIIARCPSDGVLSCGTFLESNSQAIFRENYLIPAAYKAGRAVVTLLAASTELSMTAWCIFVWWTFQPRTSRRLREELPHSIGEVEPRGQKWPAGHVSHETAFSLRWNFPAGQKAHSSWPCSGCELPGGQEILSVPPGHLYPSGQISQTPPPSEYVPASHGEFEPSTLLQAKPAEQSPQALAPGAEDCSTPSTAGQSLQAERPETSANVPLAHLAQSSTSS